MAIARVATEYVFSDFLLKEQSDSKYKGVRLELATDKLVSFIAVGRPLLLISLAFAQEVSVGTQIKCFPSTNFTLRQAAYVDSFCWAAVEHHPTENGADSAPLALLLVAADHLAPPAFLHPMPALWLSQQRHPHHLTVHTLQYGLDGSDIQHRPQPIILQRMFFCN
uniref:Pannexin 1b n=1 Tax=Sinocyclocheilus anshuiensis TaxID=1608454 RepID=A0A671S8E3_9TELE